MDTFMCEGGQSAVWGMSRVGLILQIRSVECADIVG